MLHHAQRLYTAAQVRRLDEAVIRGTVQPPAVAGIDLMERAGRAVFEAAVRHWPQARRWLVLCGSGNNGGDGYIVARLAREAGRDVTLCALKDPASLAGDAATAARRWREAGGQALAWPGFGSGSGIGDHDLVVDALFGTTGNGAVRLLAAACHDFKVYIWERGDAERPRSVLAGHSAEVAGLCFSPSPASRLRHPGRHHGGNAEQACAPCSQELTAGLCRI